MKKRILTSLLIILIVTLSTKAQFTPKTVGISSFARFNKSETYVVLTEKEEINEALKKAVKEIWKLNVFHFITEKEFSDISSDRDKSFIYIHTMKQKGVSKKIKVVALVNGGYDQMTTYVSNTLAYISIDNDGYESNELDFIYRIPNIIQELSDIVTIIKEENISEKTEAKVRKKMIKYYNKKCGILKNKTLLIDRRYLNQKIVSEREFTSLYNFNVEFVSKNYIEKVIASKSKAYAYLISALNLFKNNYVVDCETGGIIYADFEEEDKLTHEFEKTFTREDIIQLNGHVKIGK